MTCHHPGRGVVIAGLVSCTAAAGRHYKTEQRGELCGDIRSQVTDSGQGPSLLLASGRHLRGGVARGTTIVTLTGIVPFRFSAHVTYGTLTVS
jgi:hypothetical protein